jgi:hypothetical protein
MKKLLIGFAGVIMLVFVVILFVNARESTQEVKKAQTEAKKDATNGSCMMQSNHCTGTKAQSCNPANCKGTNCDPEKCKNANCDHTNYKGNCEKAGTETKSCDPANCPDHTKEPVVK